jgi:hypothetical protein
MILWQLKMLNGKVLFDGRQLKVRRSDKDTRFYAKLRSKRY